MRIHLGLSVLALVACSTGHTDEPTASPVSVTVIGSRMQEYVSAMRTMDVDHLASFYSPMAELLEPGIPPIHTRDSILAFMRFFAGAKVNSAEVEPRLIEILDSTALYWGDFHENLDFPGQPTSDQQGRFLAEWKLQRDGTWLIERMYRIPVSTMVADSMRAQHPPPPGH